jgi:hypothetical protein
MRPKIGNPVISIAPVQVVHTYAGSGHSFGVSAPILVGKNDTFLHFPTGFTMPSGRLVVQASTVTDAYTESPTSDFIISENGGQSWAARYSSIIEMCRCSSVNSSNNVCGLGDVIRIDGSTERLQRGAIFNQNGIYGKITEGTITGLPSIEAVSPPNVAGNVWCNSVTTTAGKLLTAGYCRKTGETAFTLFCIESTDGYNWTYKSVLCPSTYPVVADNAGPSECALVRTASGILAVFRTNSETPASTCLSTDEGVTWSAPTQTTLGVVAPSLWSMTDGTLLATTGYAYHSGHIFLDESVDSGATWIRIYDLFTHHNLYSSSPIVYTSGYIFFGRLSNTEYALIYDNDDRSVGPHESELWCQRMIVS